MWRRPAWFSLKGKGGVRCRKKTLSYATQPLSTNHPADPCNICGRPLPGKGKLQDCRGAWSDAAICPASGAAANRRGPVWEFADRVQITAAYSRYGVAHWLSRSRLVDRYAMPSFRSPHALAAPARLRGRRRSPINAPLDQQGPDDAGRLVG